MRLGHIGLTCSDLNRSERFYSDLFGFKTFFRIRRNTPWLAAQVGYPNADIEFCHMRGLDGLHLELLKYWGYAGALPLADDTFFPGNVHINIWVEDINLFVGKATAWFNQTENTGLMKFAGHAHDLDATMITDGPQKGGKGFYLRDPDGHSIEILQPAEAEASGLTPEISKIIDRIEAARSQNNTNWCDLIRLCYRAAPDEARKIFRRIEKKDDEIRALAEESSRL